MLMISLILKKNTSVASACVDGDGVKEFEDVNSRKDGSGAGLLRYGKSRSVGGEEGTVQEEELLSLQHFVGLFINWDSAQNRQGSHD